jgi:hypothetical protein
MPSFAVSISVLGLVQAALVVLPRSPLPPLQFTAPRSNWWALVPGMSIVVVVLVVNFYEDSATFLTYLALVAVPPLAAGALGWLVRGARPAWALAIVPLFALAWALPDALAGEATATALSALSCVALGWMLVSVVPARWLRLGIYAMAAVDAWLVAGNLLQGPNSVLSVAAPAADLPRLQAIHLGAARMGFGDLFVAALVGCLLAAPAPAPSTGADGPKSQARLDLSAHRQLLGAGLVALLALSFDLLFFAVDSLPATVPVAVALALVQRFGATGAGSSRRASRSPRRRRGSGGRRSPAGR